MAAVVLPLPGPVFTMMRPRRMSAMHNRTFDSTRSCPCLYTSHCQPIRQHMAGSTWLDQNDSCPIPDSPVPEWTIRMEPVTGRLRLSRSWSLLRLEVDLQ